MVSEIGQVELPMEVGGARLIQNFPGIVPSIDPAPP